MLQRGDVVDDLADVECGPAVGEQLEGEDVVHRALGALDLGAQQCFLADVHRQEQIGIGQGPRQPVEAAYGDIGSREQPPELVVQSDRWVRW